MNVGLTELVFILDRSGSMGGLESDTIGGFNGMLTKQKNLKEGSTNVTTVLFDDKVEVIHDRFPIDMVQPLTDEDYYVRGCTALLDAVGESITKIDSVQAHLPEEHRAGKVMFVITTDGCENSSREYSYEKVRKLIEARKEKGWEFLFLGANIDAAKEAERIGIARNRSVTYENDSEGVGRNFEAVDMAVSSYRKCCSSEAADLSMAIPDDWSEEVSAYHESKIASKGKRGRKTQK